MSSLNPRPRRVSSRTQTQLAQSDRSRLLGFEGLESRRVLAASTPATLWAVPGGGKGDDSAYSVATWSDGSSVVTGTFTDTAFIFAKQLTSNGSTDAFIAKLNPQGSTAWAINIGGTGYDTISSVATCPDGTALITGTFTGSAKFPGAPTLVSKGTRDIFVAKLSPAGSFLWAVRMGGTQLNNEFDASTALSVFPDGSAIVAGWIKGPAEFGSLTWANGAERFFVAKVTANGSSAWAIPISGFTDSGQLSVAAFADGSSVITGSYNKSMTVGSKTLTCANTSLFIAKLDNTGNCIWAKQPGGSGSDAWAIAALPDGSSLITGSGNGPLAFGSNALPESRFVLKVNNLGDFVWATGFNDVWSHGAISSTADGSAVVTGSFNGTASFGSMMLTAKGGSDAYIARIDASGKWRQVATAGGVGDDAGYGVATLSDGSAIVCGGFRNTAAFGQSLLQSSWLRDAFVWKVKLGRAPDAPGAPAAASDPLLIGPIQIPGAKPTAPLGVFGVPVEGGVLVSWPASVAKPQFPGDPKSALTNYEIEYSTEGITWTPVPRPLSTACFQYVSVTHPKPLIFRVRGVNGYGTGDYGYPSNYVVPGATATPAWQYVNLPKPTSDGGSPILGYRVQVSYDGGKTWNTTVAGPLVNQPFKLPQISDTTPYLYPNNRITGLDWNRSFVLRSAAVNEWGQGPWSPVSPIFNKGIAPTPNTVLAVSVAVSNGIPLLSWTKVPNASHYVVFVRKQGDASWTVFDVLGSTTTQRTLAGLPVDPMYAVKVVPLNQVGLGTQSLELSVGVPSAPGNLSGTPGNGQVTLNWNAPSSNGGSPISDYVIQYSSDGNIWTPFSDAVSGLTTAVVNGLTNGTAYRFRLAAVNAIGQSTYSLPSGIVVPRTTPGTPTSLVGTAGIGQVTLSWTAPASNGGSPIYDYWVQYKVTGQPDSAYTTFGDGVSAATTMTIGGLIPGTSYTFRMFAQNGVGLGTASAPVVVAIPAKTAPSAPTGLVATSSGGQVNLRWIAPADNGGSAITNYIVQYKVTGQPDTTYKTMNTRLPTSLSQAIRGLPLRTSYTFRVFARNAIGTGPASASSLPVTVMP
jgi:hypothetical protein